VVVSYGHFIGLIYLLVIYILFLEHHSNSKLRSCSIRYGREIVGIVLIYMYVVEVHL
jgi:hypothetical protein